MLNDALEVPPLFAAVMVYVAVEDTAAGVPDKVQVDDKLNPAGKLGDEEHELIAPPAFAALSGVMATPLV